jgi:hypothetical protein
LGLGRLFSLASPQVVRGRGNFLQHVNHSAERASIQPASEFLANKSKLMKGKESKFAFFSFHLFFRIGTFQRVTPDSNKKIPVAISGCARLSEVNFSDVCFLLVGSLSTAGFDSVTANGIA